MSPRLTPLKGRHLALVLRDLRIGGAERQAILLAEELAGRGEAQVEVWCFSGGEGPNRRRLDELGIPVIEMSPGSSANPLHRSLQLIRFLVAARRRNVDLLIPLTDWPNKVCGALWPLLGARASVWNQRDEGREITEGLLERLSLRLSTVFACNASSGESFLRERMGVSGHRIVRIRNWVRPEPPQKTPAAWRRELGVPDERLLVLMVANLHPFKDHPTLLRAWRLVLDRMEETQPLLLLAGRPQGRRLMELEALTTELEIGGNIRFLGEIDDLSGLLSTVDLLVHSSRREGCPNAVLEAMASDVPVIATAIPGILEALGPESSFLVPEGDAEALAGKITQLLQSPDLLSDCSTEMQRAFENYSTPEQALESYIQLLGSLLA